jgi:hypothetical protein
MMRYLTAQEIAALYRRPVGTVYRLASADRWRRIPDNRRPVLYRCEDVETTFTRLAGATELDQRPAVKDAALNVAALSA